MSRYGSKYHHKHDPVTPSRKLRRSKVMLAKHEQGWSGFFFWMTMAGISLGIMIVVINNI